VIPSKVVDHQYFEKFYWKDRLWIQTLQSKNLVLLQRQLLQHTKDKRA